MKKTNSFSLRRYCREEPEAIMLCVVFLLCLVCACFDRFWLHRTDEFLGALIFETVTFIAPVAVYFLLRYKNISASSLTHELNISKISHRLVFLPIVSTILLIFGTLILDMMFFGVYDITEGFMLYGLLIAVGDGGWVSTVCMIITFAILPAIFEEIVFRKLLMKRYAKKGLFPAVLISGIFYCLTPFSVRLLPSFFFAGMIYCLIFLVTGSLATSIITHFLFNMYGLFLRTNVANYFISASDVYVLVISSVIVFLIAAIMLAGLLSKLFIAYARAGRTPPPTPHGKSGFAKAIGSSFGIFKSPANLICLIIYAVFVIVFAFFG